MVGLVLFFVVALVNYTRFCGPVYDWHQPVGVGHAARVIMGNKVGCTVRGGIGIWAGDLSWIVCEFGFS